MSLDVAAYVAKDRKGCEEVPAKTRGLRMFRHANGSITAVQFSRGYRRLGVRIDVHAAAPNTPLVTADRYLFVDISDQEAEEVMLDIHASKLLPMLRDRAPRFDEKTGKTYISLKD